MMKRVFNLFLLGMSLFFCFRLMAQQTNKTKTPVKLGNSKKIFLPPVYLGKSNLYGGTIKKRTFDSLLKQGITARDSLGNKYKIVGFDFSYAERGLYEDSVGNDQILTDFQSQYEIHEKKYSCKARIFFLVDFVLQSAAERQFFSERYLCNYGKQCDY